MISPTGKKRNRSGVTLVEVCLACALIAVIAGISWPSLSRFAAESKLENAGGMAASLLAYARDAAVIEGYRYRVNMDASARSCEVSAELDPMNGPGTFTPVRDSVAGKHSFPEGIEIGECSAPAVSFEPDGTAEDFTLTLRNNRGSALTLRVTGRNGRCELSKRKTP